jgi:Tol biopolymer transport system component
MLPPDVSKSERWEFWTVRPDGNDNRLEFVDSLTRNNIGFSWSPDGKAIAWLRDFPGNSVEIVIHDLLSGKVRQLTVDRTNIDDVSWAPNNVIIYSSTKGGNLNLWMVAAGGGEPVQITKETGPDTGIRISADGRKMVYLQGGHTVGHVWLVPVDGTPAQQVTFDETDIRWPALSPDGKRIAFQTFEGGARIYLMDRDGSNRRQLTSSDRESNIPKWSPDGRWIAFYSRLLAAPADPYQVYIIDARDPQTPRLIKKGGEATWVDDTTLTVIDQGRSWLVSKSGGEAVPFFEDSTMAEPILSRRYILYRDFRRGREGVWLIPADHQHESLSIWAKRIGSFPAEFAFASKEKLFMIKGQRELWQLKLPEETWENLHVTLPSIRVDFITGGVSRDGKEIVYSDSHSSAKLVMIENLFK